MTQTSEVLTEAQISLLRTRYQEILVEHRRDDTQKGLWAPLYNELYDLITDFSGVNEPKAGVDYQSWLWLRGARYVNAGDGPFAALIRDYTIIQHTLRYGYPATDDEMDRASNNIAINFLGQWLGFGPDNRDGPPAVGTIPTILETGLFDAGPAAAAVFNKEVTEGDPAGWAGTLLFGNLGASEFWRGLILKSLIDPASNGSIDDPSTPNEDLPQTRDSGSYNAIAAVAALQEWEAARAALNAVLTPSEWAELVSIFWAQSGYAGVVDLLADDTNSAFRALYGLSGDIFGEDPNPDIGLCAL